MPFLIASWCEPEKAVNKVAGVGVARVHRQLRAFLDGARNAVDVGKIELRVDALRVEIEREGDKIDVAGAFAVSEETALDALGTGHHRQFGGGDGAAAVVVRMHADDHAVTARDVAVHPLDLVGVNVGRCHLHRRRQIEDHLAFGRRAPGVRDRVADLTGELEFGCREGFRAVFERPVRFRPCIGECGSGVRHRPPSSPPRPAASQRRYRGRPARSRYERA